MDINLENLDEKALIELMTMLQGMDEELQEELKDEKNSESWCTHWKNKKRT